MPSCVVTIGIPTYCRPTALERAVRSALAQDHPQIRVLISDDASPDHGATVAACAALARDPRVRVIRQPRNLGFTGNYNATLAAADTELFMWLADDDWLEPDYVSRCVAALEQRPEGVAAGGTARLITAEGRQTGEDCVASCQQPTAHARVLAYCAQVGYNSALFSVMRREAAQRFPKPHVLAGDWLFVAALLFEGGLCMVPEAVIHRSVNGMSAETGKLVKAMGLPRWQAWWPHVTIARNMAWALFKQARVRGASVSAAFRLSWLAFWLVFFRHSWGRRFWPGRYRRAWVARYAGAGDLQA